MADDKNKKVETELSDELLDDEQLDEISGGTGIPLFKNKIKD